MINSRISIADDDFFLWAGEKISYQNFDPKEEERETNVFDYTFFSQDVYAWHNKEDLGEQ